MTLTTKQIKEVIEGMLVGFYRSEAEVGIDPELRASFSITTTELLKGKKRFRTEMDCIVYIIHRTHRRIGILRSAKRIRSNLERHDNDGE